MKRIKIAFALLAVLFAVTTAFTSKDSATFDTVVWFQVHPSTGAPLDANDGQVGINPFGCDQVNDVLCSRALTLEEDEVELYTSEPLRYKIKDGIDITSSVYFDGTIRKTE